MSVHLFDGPIAGTPPEPLLLEAVTVRLLQDSERERFDQELATKHYLRNACAVGRVLRYVAEYQGQWVGLLVFSSAALHIKLRDQWLHWSPQQVRERRHLIAQNARFLILASPRRWPNLAAGVLKLTWERLPQDWLDQFGYPVQVVETFVDRERFPGTCYKVAGWQQFNLRNPFWFQSAPRDRSRGDLRAESPRLSLCLGFEACRTNDQIRAAVLLDAYLDPLPNLLKLGLQKPFLAMNSPSTGLAPSNQTLFSRATNNAYILQILNTQHETFTDQAWITEHSSVTRLASQAKSACVVQSAPRDRSRGDLAISA